MLVATDPPVRNVEMEKRRLQQEPTPLQCASVTEVSITMALIALKVNP
jgi:hypothetical protein